jgi:hypothetical protein
MNSIIAIVFAFTFLKIMEKILKGGILIFGKEPTVVILFIYQHTCILYTTNILATPKSVFDVIKTKVD